MYVEDGYKFVPDLEVTGVVHQQGLQNRINLLTASELSVPFESIVTTARVIDQGINFGRLYISTDLELSPHDEDPDSMAGLAADLLRQGQHQSYKIRHPLRASKAGILEITDKITTDVGTIIVPHDAGQTWLINSILGAVLFDEESDHAAIEAVLWQHSDVMTALCSAVFKKVIGKTAKPDTRTFRLQVRDSEALSNTEINIDQDLREDPFEDYIGLDSVVGRLRDLVSLANTPLETLEQNGVERAQSVILYGPSGVAKSALMGSLGKALEATVIEVDFSSVGHMNVGEWAKRVQAVFQSAFDMDGRVLIVIDEMDGLINAGNPEVTANISSVLKHQLDRMRQHPDVFLVAATNNIDKIDPVVIADKRIDLKLPILIPNQQERAGIFTSLLFKQELASVDGAETLMETMSVENGIDCNALAVAAEDFSGGDIVALLKEINRQRFLKRIKGETVSPAITQTELLDAIERQRLTRHQ